LGELLFPKILDSLKGDLLNTVFSYIPNTAETSFYGLVQEVQQHMNNQAISEILKEKGEITREKLEKLFSNKPRIEKVAIKDAKLRTFIADDANRDELVAHVYDITYGSIKPTDNLVIIDDSIVRGTTLQKSILKILDRLNPKKITVVSSAPQIRYPDCYGIDMARMEDFIAFRAAVELVKEEKDEILLNTYNDCVNELKLPIGKMRNRVSRIYSNYSDEQISQKISEILKKEGIKAEVNVIFQTVENLHIACPKNLGDWYFTGDYPTPGGNKVVNQAFVNYYEGLSQRAY
jgi:amidophosphoribosyltransferase